MLARRASDCKNIIEAHRNIGYRNGPGRTDEAFGGLDAAILVAINLGRTAGNAFRLQFAIHLPGDPQQEEPPAEDKAIFLEALETVEDGHGEHDSQE